MTPKRAHDRVIPVNAKGELLVCEMTMAEGARVTGHPVVVFWRPGCTYCDRLLRALAKANITPELRNIWDDNEARDFVRAHNRGNETVPTVVFDGTVRTNPDPADFVAELLASS